MKKLIFTFIIGTTLSSSVFSQTTTTTTTTTTGTPAPAPVPAQPAANTTPPQTETFDKKWRLGLRVTPQPTWFGTTNKNQTPAGAILGVGFGLNVEYRFSDVVGLVTGIGGDFEGGKYQYKFDPGNNYEPAYWMDAEELVDPAAGEGLASASRYYVNTRRINTTHVTVPLVLKLSTQEYSGMKYFGMFGVELGILTKATADDTYHYVSKGVGLDETITSTGGSIENINIRSETGTIPVRLGLNAGLGTEYRLGGTTSLFFSLNYFYSFTNLLRKSSDYTFYREEDGVERYVDQNLRQNAIRINIGLMF